MHPVEAYYALHDQDHTSCRAWALKASFIDGHPNSCLIILAYSSPLTLGLLNRSRTPFWNAAHTACCMQMFSQVITRIAGDAAPPPSPYSPWRFGKHGQLTKDLQAAGFTDVQCVTYNHPMTWALSDLIAFQIGPQGQSRPLLDKLKADGRENVYQEAEQVSAVMTLQCVISAVAKPDLVHRKYW